MLRRSFISSTLAAPLLARFSDSVTAGQGPQGTATPELYVWRQFLLRNGTGPRRLSAFLEKAAVPALNRLGVKPVGVFETVAGPAQPAAFVLAPLTSIDTFLTLEAALGQDAEFRAAAKEYLEAPASDPVYVRQEVSLLRAFPNIPRLEVPAQTAERRPRLFELRTYESHNERAHRLKMEMFTKLGELEIFRRVGLTPVFFGSTLIGPRIPNFTYMLVHDSLAAREKSWEAFRTDPAWKKLAATPGYSDAEIVSNITTWFLRPAASSQI
ncbi:MAG TPA: NIPSNAP family protein [Vicinamibacterales bacterium]